MLAAATKESPGPRSLRLTPPANSTEVRPYWTIQRVLDIYGWYLIATEYLKCCWCKKKSGVVVGHHKAATSHLQLPVSSFTHVQVRKQEIIGKCVFLKCSTFSLCFYANCCICCVTHRVSCNQRAVIHLRSCTSANSANRLYNTLRELHTVTWMCGAKQYLGVCLSSFWPCAL